MTSVRLRLLCCRTQHMLSKSVCDTSASRAGPYRSYAHDVIWSLERSSQVCLVESHTGKFVCHITPWNYAILPSKFTFSTLHANFLLTNDVTLVSEVRIEHNVCGYLFRPTVLCYATKTSLLCTMLIAKFIAVRDNAIWQKV